jgi:polar amino acid transport system substrate-binding protein
MSAVAMNGPGYSRRAMLKTAASILAVGAIGGPLLAACSSSGSSSSGGGGGTGGSAGGSANDGGSQNAALDNFKQHGAKLGIASALPYSGLGTDGKATGLGPEVTMAVLGRLGISKVTAVVASYADLVPGLQAGRWDLTGVPLGFTSARCGQVLFADPMTVDPNTFSVANSFGEPPASMDEAKQYTSKKIGMTTGYQYAPLLEQAGWKSSNILYYPDRASATTALNQGRVALIFQDQVGMSQLLAKSPGSFKLSAAVTGGGEQISGTAFPQKSTAFRDAYQTAFRAYRADGSLAAALKKWGFETPSDLANLSQEDACSNPAYQPPAA